MDILKFINIDYSITLIDYKKLIASGTIAPPTISDLTASPAIIQIGSVSIITCVASDTDNDPLTYSWSATGGNISGSGTQVNWTAPLSSGTYTITCVVSDGKDGTDTKSITVVTTSPPTISILTASPATVTIGSVSIITCVASDPDNDPLTYSWFATGGNISGSGFQVKWTAPNSQGTYTINCMVSDGKGGTATKDINIPVSVHYIGESYGGGIIFYIDDSGQHGLIAATADQSTDNGVLWYNGDWKVFWKDWQNGDLIITGATETGIYGGQVNTQRIIATQGTGNYAAQICADYRGGGYDDWYLPSIDELDLLWQQQDVVGGFANYSYWSSTEYSSNFAWTQYFTNGSQYLANKNEALRVRAVRGF